MLYTRLTRFISYTCCFDMFQYTWIKSLKNCFSFRFYFTNIIYENFGFVSNIHWFPALFYYIFGLRQYENAACDCVQSSGGFYTHTYTHSCFFISNHSIKQPELGSQNYKQHKSTRDIQMHAFFVEAGCCLSLAYSIRDSIRGRMQPLLGIVK